MAGSLTVAVMTPAGAVFDAQATGAAAVEAAAASWALPLFSQQVQHGLAAATAVESPVARVGHWGLGLGTGSAVAATSSALDQ